MGNAFDTTPATGTTANLVSSDRATQNATLAALATASPEGFASILAAASDAIRQSCMRDFTLGAYVEYHSGDASFDQQVITRQFPVTGVARVATCPTAVLVVANTSAANQRATVATTSAGLTLFRVASGVTTTVTLAYATYVTLQALADAVGNLGNGWGATVQATYGLWPSADLKPLQGAASATVAGGSGAVLEMHVEDLSPLCFGGNNSYGCDGVGWRLDEETGQIFGRFPRGRMNLRVDYTAGFATIPEPIQQACVFLAADTYLAGQRDGSLKNAQLGPYRWEAADTTRVLTQNPRVRSLIYPYSDPAKRFGRHG